MNTDRSHNEVKQTRNGNSAGSRQLRKLMLLGIVNLLVSLNVWAAISSPSQLTATSVCSNSVSLTWVDSNPATTIENSVLVLRSTRSPSKGYTVIASLAPFTTGYVDVTVVPSKTYFYKV